MLFWTVEDAGPYNRGAVRIYNYIDKKHIFINKIAEILYFALLGRTPDEGSPSFFALQRNSPTPAFLER